MLLNRDQKIDRALNAARTVIHEYLNGRLAVKPDNPSTGLSLWNLMCALTTLDDHPPAPPRD